MLPKRPPSHVLDDKAVGVFSRFIHNLGWVYRNIEKDYGIDGEVEICSDENQVSGMLSRFQIKGRKDGINSFQVKLSSLRYWMVSPIPIYIACIQFPSERLSVINVRDYVTNFSKFDFPEIKTKYFSFNLSHRIDDDLLIFQLKDTARFHHRANLDIHKYALYNPVLEYVSCKRLFFQHKGNIYKMIEWHRKDVDNEQLMYEFGHAVYLKQRIESDSSFWEQLKIYALDGDLSNEPEGQWKKPKC